jgi:hypothetical protein
MTLQKVEAWVNRLPAADRDLPIIVHGGKAWTPNEILTQIRTCPTCSTSQALQAFLEARAFGQEANPWQLAKQRLIQRMQKTPVIRHVLVLGMPTTITPEQFIREVTLETPLGQSFIHSELQRMHLLLQSF